jgi:hypothetical protein
MIVAFAISHIRKLWGDWWPLPLLPAIYALVMAAIGDLRPEHVGVSAAVLGLGYATASTKRFLVEACPGVLIALGYDVLRYARPIFVVPERVVTCGIRNVELSLFGVGANTTLADFFAAHHASIFDLVFAVPYGIFFSVAIIYSCYLYWTDPARMRVYLWALALAHAIAFATWLALPTAPPWYIQAHGCNVDTSVAMNAAGLLRVDRALGIEYFASFYARGPTPFGALPSMHCAFPMIGLLTAWRVAKRLTCSIHVLYVFSMIAASVYLDHHWLLDGLGGWLCAVVAVLPVRTVLPYLYAGDRGAVARTTLSRASP